MNLELWERQDPVQGTVYDAYVINNPGPMQAGGMPEKWLTVHCGSKEQIRAKYPNSKKSDGTPLFTAAEGTKPQETDADVPISLVMDKAAVEKFIEDAQKESDERVTTEDLKTSERKPATNTPAPWFALNTWKIGKLF